MNNFIIFRTLDSVFDNVFYFYFLKLHATAIFVNVNFIFIELGYLLGSTLRLVFRFWVDKNFINYV